MSLGTRRMVQIKEMFELGEVTYESLLRLFHGDSGFVRIWEMFELGRVELERVHCIFYKITVPRNLIQFQQTFYL